MVEVSVELVSDLKRELALFTSLMSVLMVVICDVTRGNAKRSGDQLYERRIGLAFARRRTHARFDHAAYIIQLRDTVDRIAPAAWREADGDDNAVHRCRPRPSEHQPQNT